MSLEQSDPSKIGVKILGAKGIVVVQSMSPASARHGVHSPKEQGFKGRREVSVDAMDIVRIKSWVETE